VDGKGAFFLMEQPAQSTIMSWGITKIEITIRSGGELWHLRVFAKHRALNCYNIFAGRDLLDWTDQNSRFRADKSNL
jgi:hypothetical protein